MKALVLVLVLLTMGDLVIDRGAGVLAVGHAAEAFAQDFGDAFRGSLFDA